MRGKAGNPDERRAAAYSPALHRSTIGAGGLSFSVRNGKRRDPAATATLKRGTCQTRAKRQRRRAKAGNTGRNNAPSDERFGQLVALGFGVAAFTPAPYQRRRLRRPSKKGVLILRRASRLDAFSAYPIQTRIPGGAPGGTTGRPEVCPSRSSRTSDRTTQNSNAHDR